MDFRKSALLVFDKIDYNKKSALLFFRKIKFRGKQHCFFSDFFRYMRRMRKLALQTGNAEF